MRILQCILLYAFLFNAKMQAQPFFIDKTTSNSITAAAWMPAYNNIVFFSGSSMMFYDLDASTAADPKWYNLGNLGNINGAFRWDEQLLLFFVGSQYLSYNMKTGATSGEWTLWPGLPAEWNGMLSAASRWSEQDIIFIYGKEFVLYNVNSQSYSAKGDIMNWEGWPAHWTSNLSAVTDIPGDKILFMSAGEMISYSKTGKQFSQPMAISNVSANNNSSPGLPGTKPPGTTSNSLPPGTTANNTNNNMGQLHADPILTGFTGVPKGSKMKESFSGIEGFKEGNFYTDDLPPGHQVSEVRIYTSKIWGSPVISGIQLILTSSTGLVKNQRVLGKLTSTYNSFVLTNGEYITGLSGVAGSENGNFLYGLQVKTSLKQSPVFGYFPPGKSPFNLEILEGNVFNGFQVYAANNLTGIGLKYFSPVGDHMAGENVNEQGTVGQVVQAVEQTATNAQQKFRDVVNNGNNPSNSTPKKANTQGTNNGLCSNNFEDYEGQLANQSGNWASVPVPSKEWLGSGLNILYYDPLRPTEPKARKQSVISIITSSKRCGPTGGDYNCPYGVDYLSLGFGDGQTDNKWISSYKDFSNTFGIEGSISGGKGGGGKDTKTPDYAGGSLSGSYSETNTTSTGSQQVYYLTVDKRYIFSLEMQFKFKYDGVDYCQRLNDRFYDQVKSLPFIPNIPNLSVEDNTIQKNTDLPAALKQLQSAYNSFILQWGTHVASKVYYGGKYVTKTTINQSDFASSQMSRTSFEGSAEAQIKQNKGSASIGINASNSNSSGTNKINLVNKIYALGGGGIKNLDKWESAVQQTPAAVEMEFVPLTYLLTPDFFGNDPDIEKKRQLLKIFTEKYMVDTYVPPRETDDTKFWAVSTPDVGGQIKVNNLLGPGWYSARLTVTFTTKEGEVKQIIRSDITAGFSKFVDIPAGATNIKVKCEALLGKDVFNFTYDKPVTKNFDVWGVVWDPKYEEK